MNAFRRTTLIAALLTFGSALPLGAAHADGDHAMTEGEVRRVTPGTGKVTIKHGPIENLEMPPMTMVFGVRDPAMLENLEKGDEVRFAVVEEGGSMIIEELETVE